MRSTRSFLLLAALSLALPASITSATYAARPTAHSHKQQAIPPAAFTPASNNPLLPPPVPVNAFFPELTLLQKLPQIAPASFDALYSAEDWTEYRRRFGAEADDLPRKKASGVLEFSKKLIAAAEAEKSARPGLARLLLFRAAAVCYRNRDGFDTANKAVAAYQSLMDIHSATQVGALWTISNAMSRLAVTPKPERIRYSGIAARANTQLAILLIEADQVEAAGSVIKLVGYHEGWLKSDPAVRSIIAQTRAVVRQTQSMMDYLQTQYQPAINGDDSALMALYVYGMFVKNNPALVADFPSRKPNSAMAQLAGALAAGERDPMANYTAAETLRQVAASLPDGVLKQRTLYASLDRYRRFLKAPETAHERIKRQLAWMRMQDVIDDGARAGIAIHPFETEKPTAVAASPQTRQAAHAHLASNSETRPAPVPTAPQREKTVTPEPSLPSMPTPHAAPTTEPDGPIVG